MRLLLFAIINLAALSSFAIDTITGVLLKEAGHVYLSSDSNCGRYRVYNSSFEVTANLRKLSHGDAVSATATINTAECSVDIQSIDYVGLKRLLGYWHTDAGMVTVKNFNSLMIYPKVGVQTLSELRTLGAGAQVPNPIVYRYSVLPSKGKEWVVFLSDSETTTFATLTFHRSTATLSTYDSETGVLTNEFHMIRWKQLK